MTKIIFSGKITSVQPRIRMLRSFDERSHNYLGYAIRISGLIGDENREFSIGVGKATHAKSGFQVGCLVSGECQPVADHRKESVEFYKVSKLQILEHASQENVTPPPWLGVPDDLEVYRQRGHRRLAAKTYQSQCQSCIWGSQMAVEMIIDHWNPQTRRYRMETFCYGPKSCRFYKAGTTRKVPGRKGMIWEEEDWVDEDVTSHRGPDE
jgi:hypothetical protein